MIHKLKSDVSQSLAKKLCILLFAGAQGLQSRPEVCDKINSLVSQGLDIIKNATPPEYYDGRFVPLAMTRFGVDITNQKELRSFICNITSKFLF